MSRYYVYVWTNTTDGKQYIGKGSGSRAFQHVKDSWRAGGRELAKAMRAEGAEKFALSFLGTNLTETDALALEKAKITELGTGTPGGYNLIGGERPARAELPPHYLEPWVQLARALAFIQGEASARDIFNGTHFRPDDCDAPCRFIRPHQEVSADFFRRVLMGFEDSPHSAWAFPEFTARDRHDVYYNVNTYRECQQKEQFFRKYTRSYVKAQRLSKPLPLWPAIFPPSTT